VFAGCRSSDSARVKPGEFKRFSLSLFPVIRATFIPKTGPWRCITPACRGVQSSYAPQIVYSILLCKFNMLIGLIGGGLSDLSALPALCWKKNQSH
jgi:hypothetical protein